MIRVRKSGDRGRANHGWLDTNYTFSFANYYDPEQMGFRHLRVLNEDVIEPGKGFPMHGHRDMEILTYILSGGLEHKDNMGNGSVIRPGDVQRMSAGTGVMHSEFNASDEESVHLLQIWILAEAEGLEPDYEEKNFAPEMLNNQLCLLASRDGREGSVTIHQDVTLYAGRFDSAVEVTHEFTAARHGWLQVARGDVTLGGLDLHAGDGVAISEESRLVLNGAAGAEVLLFDLA